MRSLEDHLSPHELATLPDSLDSPASPDSLEALAAGDTNLDQDRRFLSLHLQQCEACSSLAQTYWNLRGLCASSASAVGAEACPPQTVWLEFAAALRSGQASSLLAHAASCSACAFNLKEAMQLMQPDQLESTPEGLASVTPAWQQGVAKKMAATAGLPEGARSTAKLMVVPPRRRNRAWIMLPVAAAIVCAAVLTGFALWRSMHPSDARLLALAYNKQRTLALRIPGAEPVPMASITRSGGDAMHGLAEPAELLELHLRARQHLDQAPNSPYWHQVLGEIDLLQQDGFAARRNFEIAQASDDSLPNLLPDLAAAWFELGERTGNAEFYAEAAELYSRQLDDHAGDAALLHYNRALCWERQNLTQNAIDDLRAAIPLERSPAWRKAMEAEIARLGASPTSSTDLLQSDGYETALDEATQKLLPLWGTSSEAREKIEQTSALGLRHHDRWLRDWMAAGHTPITLEADRHLAAAVAVAAAGQGDSSLVEARRAIELYAQAHHQPGLLRAQLAEAYAFQRLSNPTECLAAIGRLKKLPSPRSDAWIDTQSDLEAGMCQQALGDLAAAQGNFDTALHSTAEAQLPVLQLRALGAQAVALDLRGATSAAWNLNVTGLGLCGASHCSPLREYTFLYNLVRVAQKIGLKDLPVEVMRVAERVAAATEDETTRVFAVETLATLTGRAGDYQTSEQDFAALDHLKPSGAAVAAVKLYQAEWDTDRAEILTRHGRPQEALSVLERSAPAIHESSYQIGRVAYFNQRAITDESLHRYDEALANALTAVQAAESSLAGLRSTLSREQWAQLNAAVYEELVKVYRQRGDDASAVQAWERFRRAPYALAAGSAVGRSHQAEATYVVVIAHVDSSYVGWLVNAATLQPSRALTLGDAASLHRSAVTFYHLCSDRNSAIGDVRAVGARLYTALFGALASQPGVDAGRLFVDIDPSLSMLPIPALTTAGGGWLGAERQVTVLPPWWSLHPDSALADERVRPDMRMVIVNGFGRASSDDSEVAQLSHLFPHSTVVAGAGGTPGAVTHALLSANLFHFAGHASADGESQAPAAEGTLATMLPPEAVDGLHLSSCLLAVLAACNTTVADPDRIERLPDLRNALLLSGTHAVAASSWDVDDRSTHQLMLNFYDQLVAGRSPAQALQTAQHDVSTAANWQHPYFWAAFQIFTN